MEVNTEEYEVKIKKLDDGTFSDAVINEFLRKMGLNGIKGLIDIPTGSLNAEDLYNKLMEQEKEGTIQLNGDGSPKIHI